MGRQAVARDEINVADSTCDPNARKVTMLDCSNDSTAIYGCFTVNGGQVPQINQVTSPGAYIAGTNPLIPVYYLITHVDPQDPNLLGNADFPTVPNVYSCGYNCPTVIGGGCVWGQGGVGQFTSWQACNNAVNAGACFTQPTHYCSDYNVFEIIYPRVTYTGSTGKDEATVLNEIISRTTGGLYPYSDPGGVWNGFSLTQMANTAGTSAIGGTSIYNPLKGSLDDCIACCGGVNQQSYSNGTPNPYYNMSTHPTPHAGYAAYLAVNSLTQSSGTFIDYMLSIGVDSCGLTANNAGVRI